MGKYVQYLGVRAIKNTVKVILLAAVLFSLINTYAYAVTNKDVVQIHKDINEMFAAFEAGDASLLLSMTHNSIYKLAGGKANFKNILVSAIKDLMEQGVIFHSSTLGKPTMLHSAGDEEVCFIPRTSIIEIDGQKIKSTGFMIAIRSRYSENWKYLDGSGFRKDQGMLWKLLPELSREVELPVNYIEKF